jgi:hypothetical protein
MAEKPIAPAIAPAPTIFFRDHAIPFSDVNSWPENVPVDTYPKVDSLSMNRLCRRLHHRCGTGNAYSFACSVRCRRGVAEWRWVTRRR